MNKNKIHWGRLPMLVWMVVCIASTMRAIETHRFVLMLPLLITGLIIGVYFFLSGDWRD